MVTQSDEDQPVGDLSDHVFDGGTMLGVRILRDPDPVAHAEQLAQEVSGEVVLDLEHAEQAFTARAEAGRAEPVVLSDSERAELTARIVAAESGQAETETDESTIAEIRRLAEDLAMTERIRSNTESTFTDTLSRRISAANAVAIHPGAIRQAANAVTDAEARVADSEADLRDLGPRPGSQEFADAASESSEHPAMFDEHTLERSRRRKKIALVIAVVAVLAAAGLAVAGLLIAAIAVVAVGLLVSAVFLFRSRARHTGDASGEQEASELLASATADADLTGRPRRERRPPPANEEEWLARTAHVETAREAAEERLRSARRHWESLVGSDADPHDVDELLRVRDPQFELVGAASKTSPTVRTVSAVHRQALARWRVAWAAAGYDQPPELDELDEHFERLLARGPEAVEAARQRLAGADLWQQACATIDRPIVLLDPATWLAPERLDSMVGQLPAGAEVIIVEADAAVDDDADA